MGLGIGGRVLSRRGSRGSRRGLLGSRWLGLGLLLLFLDDVRR